MQRFIDDLLAHFPSGDEGLMAMVDLTVLVAIADGRIDQAEMAALTESMEAMVGSRLAPTLVGHLVNESRAQIVSLGASELLPAVAVVPFLVYQLADFGTLHYVVSKAANWAINIAIFVLIGASYAANRGGDFLLERRLVGVLVIIMGVTVIYGVTRLRRLQAAFDADAPHKEKKDKKDKDEKKKDKKHGDEKE